MVARQERDIFFSCVADKVLLKDNPSPMLLKGRGWGREEREKERGRDVEEQNICLNYVKMYCICLCCRIIV